jgi:hypothetical protein
MGAWLLHWLGLDNASGPVYLFWSGFFGDVTILSIPVTLLRKHNCEVKGCVRLGLHHWNDPATNQDHHLCRTHHPLGHLTAAGVCESQASKLEPQTQPEEH